MRHKILVDAGLLNGTFENGDSWGWISNLSSSDGSMTVGFATVILDGTGKWQE